jgi:hypothetical protein
LDGARLTGKVGDAWVIGQLERTHGVGEHSGVVGRGLSALHLTQRSSQVEVIPLVGGLDHPMDLGRRRQRPQHRGERHRRRLFAGEHVIRRVRAYHEIALGPGELDVVADGDRPGPTTGRCQRLRITAMVEHHEVEGSDFGVHVVD